MNPSTSVPLAVNPAPVAPVINVEAPAPLAGRIEANISIASIIGHTILWAILIVCTFGIGLFFYPYAFAKLVINRCTLVDGYGRRSRLRCNINIVGNVGHIIIWALISICTLGIGFFFYVFKVFNYALNNTRVEP